MKMICQECETDIRVYRREAMEHLDRALAAEKKEKRAVESLEALWNTLGPSKSKWIQWVLRNSKAAYERPL